MSPLYGYIFLWEGFSDSETDVPNSKIFRDALKDISSFKSIPNERIIGSPRWSVYWFLSSKPLLGEEPDMYRKDPYTYKILFRVNEKTDTVIIAGDRYSIAEAAVATFNTYINPNFKRKIVNISRLSDNLFKKGFEKFFAVTYLLADVPGYGAALNTIALHGDDIAEADFLSREALNFTARQIGVRPVDNRYECGRFGNLGTIQFRRENIPGLEKFLNYAYQEKLYVE